MDGLEEWRNMCTRPCGGLWGSTPATSSLDVSLDPFPSFLQTMQVHGRHLTMGRAACFPGQQRLLLVLNHPRGLGQTCCELCLLLF